MSSFSSKIMENTQYNVGTYCRYKHPCCEYIGSWIWCNCYNKQRHYLSILLAFLGLLGRQRTAPKTLFYDIGFCGQVQVDVLVYKIKTSRLEIKYLFNYVKFLCRCMYSTYIGTHSNLVTGYLNKTQGELTMWQVLNTNIIQLACYLKETVHSHCDTRSTLYTIF